MSEESLLVIEELGRFQLPSVAVFDPKDLVSLIFHDEDRNPHLSDYPPVVYCPCFRKITPKTFDTPEQTVSLRKISLAKNSSGDVSVVPGSLLADTDYRFMSPAHILPLARAIMDSEWQKWSNTCRSGQRYEIPWKNGKQHTLFDAFMVDKCFTLNLVEVAFGWYEDETFGLGISCLDPDDGYGELLLATYVEKDAS
jgi:hypothetical protein